MRTVPESLYNGYHVYLAHFHPLRMVVETQLLNAEFMSDLVGDVRMCFIDHLDRGRSGKGGGYQEEMRN